MFSVFAKLLRGIAVGLAVIVTMLAIALGAFRLMLAQLPSYQAQLQTWVMQEVGLGFEFQEVSARWRLAGPELVFGDARLAGSNGEVLLTAQRAGLGLSMLALLEGRIVVSRLALEDTRLTLIRNADGRITVHGVTPGTRALTLAELPTVRVTMRGGQIDYIDDLTGALGSFDLVQAELQRHGDQLMVEARALFAGLTTTELDLSLQGTGITAPDQERQQWRVFLALQDVDLPSLSTVLNYGPLKIHDGYGNVSVWLDFAAGRLAGATAELALTDVRLDDPVRGESAAYESMRGIVEWNRDGSNSQLAIGDLELRQPGAGAWPHPGRLMVGLVRGRDEAVEELRASAEFVRLHDITPLIRLLPDHPWRALWLRSQPTGDLWAVELELEKGAMQWDYSVGGRFHDLGTDAFGQWPELRGMSGELRASRSSGRLELTSRDAQITWPETLRQPIPLDRLEGTLIWRLSQAGYRVVSDDLLAVNADVTARSSLELMLPADPGSPRIDLEAELSSFDLTAVKRYLPVGKLPQPAVDWIDAALVAGRVEQARLTLFGPLDAIPFDAGDGELRFEADVANATLAYREDWPAATVVTGHLEFLNSAFSGSGRAQVMTSQSDDLRVTIRDLRAAVVEIDGAVQGPLGDVLDFLRQSPPLARRLGPEFARVSAPAGHSELALDIAVPLDRRNAPTVTAELAIVDAELALDGIEPRISELQGRLSLADEVVTGQGLEGVLLEGPIRVQVGPSIVPGYRARLDIEGEVAADAVLGALGFGQPDQVAGQTAWSGVLWLPAVAGLRAPLRIGAASNLSGIALRYPAPLRKSPAEPVNLQVDVTFVSEQEFVVDGHLGATRRFALAFDRTAARPRFRRGELRLGGELPELPAQNGLRIVGQLPELSLDAWLTGSGAPWSADLGDSLLGSRLEIADFSAFGQQLGHTELAIVPERAAWQVTVESQPISGVLQIPRGTARRAPVTARMQRLYLASAEESATSTADPRTLPGLALEAEAFALDSRQLGRATAQIETEPLGLRLVSFETTADSFQVTGSGAWFVGTQGSMTRLAFNLVSHDVAQTLVALGFDPLVNAEYGEVSASVYWPGTPGDDWARALNGDLAMRVTTGSLPDLEPGAGRVMGLMSVTALPRRLALDFRDVFNRGLVFDEIAGDFVMVDGDAYTDNVKLTGPAVEIGIVGRTGLRDRDYAQQAVVTAEPGNMLPTVGGLIAGPGVGAALLIFTRIFKEPLKGIGRASYCVGGTWEEPTVERISLAELAAGRLCADLPPQGVSMIHPP
jgi:uncharacterized protein (TIGR02099 family)